MASAAVGLHSLVQMLQQFWIARFLLPPALAGASESGDEARCRQVGGASKCKTLERFYTARDLFEPVETAIKMQRSPSKTNGRQVLSLSDGSSVSEQEIRRIFQAVDEEGNGRISRAKLARFMKKLHDVEYSEQQIDSLLLLAGVEHQGAVEFEEFVRLYHSLLESCQDADETRSGRQAADSSDVGLRDAFNFFDKNKDGFISPEELQLVVKCLNLPKKITDCSRMIRAVDKDGDGRVNFEEFKLMMLSTSDHFQ